MGWEEESLHSRHTITSFVSGPLILLLSLPISKNTCPTFIMGLGPSCMRVEPVFHPQLDDIRPLQINTQATICIRYLYSLVMHGHICLVNKKITIRVSSCFPSLKSSPRSKPEKPIWTYGRIQAQWSFKLLAQQNVRVRTRTLTPQIYVRLCLVTSLLGSSDANPSSAAAAAVVVLGHHVVVLHPASSRYPRSGSLAGR